ncbi:4Fe-4S dicluster domain-containing protein [Candidatus Bipolaricaulota bacterium]
MKGIHTVEGLFPDNCIGCRTCEIVCSLVHEGAINSSKSRITVRKEEKIGFSYPVACIQCADPECAKVCPVGAISVVEGAVPIDAEACIGCGKCVMACPIAAIKILPDTHKPIKCDLCDGSPQCIEWCPRNILKLRQHQHRKPDYSVESLLLAAITELSAIEEGS